MNKAENRFSCVLKIFLRLMLAAAIIGILVCLRKDQLRQCLNAFDYKWMIPAMLCYLLHLLVCAWRWRHLAQLAGFDLTGFEAVSLTMQGCFFSLVIPGGAIGGDVAKMGLLARRSTQGTRAEGIFTILMDRIIGMLALFSLCITLTMTFAMHTRTLEIGDVHLSSGKLLLAALLVSAVCLAGIVCGVAIFFIRKLKTLPGVAALFNWLDRHGKNIISRMTAMADQYAKYPAELIKLTVITVFGVHLMCILPMFFMLSGAGVELTGSNILLVLTAVCLGNIAGLIPVTPGGIGLRDLTVITLLNSGGILAGTGETAQLLSTGITIFINLLGGLFLVFAPAVVNTDQKQESGKI